MSINNSANSTCSGNLKSPKQRQSQPTNQGNLNPPTQGNLNPPN